MDSRNQLDDWTESTGYGSVDHVICPHCRERYTVSEQHCPDGLYHCSHCQGAFDLRRTESPLGPAWLTQQVAP